MCDIDEMYEGDENEIDDELLISLVQANPVLYDKKDKNFKNAQMKKDRWTAISSGCGASSGEAAERRWGTLRNLLGRKMRELKEKGPSGGAGGKKTALWPLLGPMSFLLPFIDNRKKRGSTVTESRSNSHSPVPHRSPTPVTTTEEHTTAEDTTQSVWDSCATIFPTGSEVDKGEILFSRSSPNPTGNEQGSSRGLSADDRKRLSSSVPPADNFARKKSKKLDKVEAVMEESAKAMSVVAQALAAPEVEKEVEKEHPYMSAVKKAFADVPPEKEMECFMAIMNVIATFK